MISTIYFGLLLINSKVQVHAPTPTVRQEFDRCEMGTGRVVDLREHKGPCLREYKVRHVCEYSSESVWYCEGRLRDISPTKKEE